MAAPSTLPALLDSLTQSLTTSLDAAPKGSIAPPQNGISLLDTKNELLASYLQNLVFLILLKLRNANKQSSDDDNAGGTMETVVKKLVELRLYLEKGVRPLEDKLRYQIEKILRAADDAERNTQAVKAAQGAGSDDSDDSASDGESGSDEEEEEEMKAAHLQARPDAFVRPAAASSAVATAAKNGVYRPPRIAPTIMPSERKEKSDRRPLKSHTMDEFIEHELSTAPIAEPSIGTTIVNGGRRMKTAADRKTEDERREYEEANFTRLPTSSKKAKKEEAMRTGNGKRMQFGGEEWRDLGEGVDRINRLTARKSGGGSSRDILDKSRKRGRDTADGPRGSGQVEMGERFQKKAKMLEAGRRDRGKR
ncbi:Sas10/Utp3/C1D family protein [Colletotrichum abscissum]|uniref:Sas10/Utp3/C1D family protein n=1 Tax=Colletotrichum abscissum TaxID=1671311 RepID=A0A9P9XMZ8_9PEZI|nr:Sas10/Utp3/C1D family protein [Colletotrichum abscissum]KAI3556859.1 Sas10/Utp3/C1D family protein [Colletotrichum abscissum]KAK1501061.1 Sas10/Utp3/C1D family protein [Colletotrichum abscissum]